MHIDTLIAEIRESWQKYDAQGFINDDSCYRWARHALKGFGQNIMEIHSAVIYVSGGKATLPPNFHALYDAIYADPDYYCTSGSKNAVVESFLFKERTERQIVWNSCDSCCKEESETTVTETIYLEDTKVDFYYKEPVRLRLGKSKNKEGYAQNCKNKFVKLRSANEITINKNTLYTNFDSGTIFIEYYGTPADEQGLPIIPDTPQGHVELYVEYYIKLRILEDIIANSDDTNVVNLFNYYVSKERDQKSLADTDAKFSTLTPRSFNRLRNVNRIDTMKYEICFPSI